jgi:uncharacterized protein (DUF2141 family)
MQTILTYLTLTFTAFILNAQNTIEVEMTGFNSNEGKVLVGLYDSEVTFLKKEMRTLSSTIQNKKAKVLFTDIPDGIYAISCYHDEDSSGTLNMFLGIYPAEDYGTSNNAPARFGPPEWEDARFTLKGGIQQLTIKL